MASPLLLCFAQNVDKLDQLGTGSVALALSLPRGAVAVSPLLSQISNGRAFAS